MKHKYLGILAVIFLFLSLLTGCNNGVHKSKLATPENILLNEDILSWDQVSNAQSYEITIGSSQAFTVSETNINLLLYEESFDLITKIIIVAKAEDYFDSDQAFIHLTKENGVFTITLDRDLIDVVSNVGIFANSIYWDEIENINRYAVKYDGNTYEVAENYYSLVNFSFFRWEEKRITLYALDDNGTYSRPTYIYLVLTETNYVIFDQPLETLNSPKDEVINDNVLSWLDVGASYYRVTINNHTVKVFENSISLQTFITDNDHKRISIIAYSDDKKPSRPLEFYVKKDLSGAISFYDFPVLDYIDFYYINDFHGKIKPKDHEMGLAYIANFIAQRRLENPNFVLLSGGDMFQGSALSNHFRGSVVIEAMNAMGFDAMALGNHEFDWGLDEVLKYFEEETKLANFPLLSINTKLKGTNIIPDPILPFVVVEKGGYKIGVIGAMGQLESSISYSKVKDYEFTNSINEIKDAASYLRVDKQVDLVVVVTHDENYFVNEALASFTGDSKINIIFNAHTHIPQISTIYNTPIIQAGRHGEYVGFVRYYLDGKEPIMENLNKRDNQDFNTPDLEVQGIISFYEAQIKGLYTDPIIKNGSYISRSSFSDWLARLMAFKTGAVVGIHNYGGTRNDLPANKQITAEVLLEIFPFENEVITVELTGLQIKNIFSVADEGLAFYSTQSVQSLNNNTYYLVATNDFLFEKYSYYYDDFVYPFMYGKNRVDTNLTLLEVIRQELILQAEKGLTFYLSNDIQTIPEAYNYLQQLPFFVLSIDKNALYGYN